MSQSSSPTPAPKAAVTGRSAAAAPHAAQDDSLLQRARAEWRRVRRSFTVENVKQSAKTLMWVVPLTIMIWIYAEQEQIAQDGNIQVRVRLDNLDPNLVVHMTDPADGVVLVDLSGPRAALDRVEASLRGPGDSAVHVKFDNLKPGPASPQIINQIGMNDLLVKNGVNVLRCVPAQVQLDVDRLLTVDAEVVAPDGLNLDAATFDPPTIKVRGPQKLIASLQDGRERLSVTADLANQPSLKKPGNYKLADVPLVKPSEDSDLVLLTTRANAQVAVKATDVTFKFDQQPIPIWISTPQQGFEWTKYKVSLGENQTTKVPNVVVSGPVDEIKKLTDPNAPVSFHAEVSIPGSQALQGVARIRYVDLPPGVTVVSDGFNGQISYTIVPL